MHDIEWNRDGMTNGRQDHQNHQNQPPPVGFLDHLVAMLCVCVYCRGGFTISIYTYLPGVRK